MSGRASGLSPELVGSPSRVLARYVSLRLARRSLCFSLASASGHTLRTYVELGRRGKGV